MNLVFNILSFKQYNSYKSLPTIAILKKLTSTPQSYYSYIIDNNIININYIDYISNNNITTKIVSFPILNNNSIDLTNASYYINSNKLIKNNILLNEINLTSNNIKKDISLFNIIGNYTDSNYRQFKLLPSVSNYSNNDVTTIRDTCFLSWTDLNNIEFPFCSYIGNSAF